MSAAATNGGAWSEIADRFSAVYSSTIGPFLTRRGSFVRTRVSDGIKTIHTRAGNIADDIDSIISDVGTSANVHRVAGYSIHYTLETMWYVGPDTPCSIGYSLSRRCTLESLIIIRTSSANTINRR